MKYRPHAQILFSLCFGMLSLTLLAQNRQPFLLEKDLPSYTPLDDYLEVYIDSTRTQDSLSIQSPTLTNKFFLLSQCDLDYSRKNIYWGRLEIHNPHHVALYRHIFVGYAKQMDIYVYQNGKFLEHKKAGALRPLKYQDIPVDGNGSITFSSPPKSTTMLWFKLQDHPRGDWHLAFAPKISTMEQFVVQKYYQWALNFIFWGGVMGLCAYHILISLLYNDRVYLHYGLYLFCICLLFGYRERLFFKSFHHCVNILKGIG